ncbi:adenylate/guanylate cyclase domain-containing protein [Gordonia alkanivorans]|uniref:adenylate/guanylate cyclase domain-containing protein n=1 Tax=Gordonia alkanivorans TaxID=84096 RepID=UPI001F4F0747|nr:adenylate/guanylate cyclase domain-containing protein [Gordonia alkanivorans]
MTTPPPQHGHHHGDRADELAGLERREVAVAFVDLAGYSVLTEMCGDQEAAELAIRLAAQARQALQPGTRLVKTIGDAVMLTADTPEAMLATITTLADAAARQDGFLALRAGIHYGSAIIRDGDLFGHAVNVAARITALAGAGHAVITDPILPATTRAGLTAAAIGPRSLRNISTPIRLHTLDLAASPHPADPVCGVRVDPATAPAHRMTTDGKWWFCSTACADRFTAPYTRGPVSLGCPGAG